MGADRLGQPRVAPPDRPGGHAGAACSPAASPSTTSPLVARASRLAQRPLAWAWRPAPVTPVGHLVGARLVETLARSAPTRRYIIGGLALVPFADLEWPTREVAGLLAVLALRGSYVARPAARGGLTCISSTWAAGDRNRRAGGGHRDGGCGRWRTPRPPRLRGRVLVGQWPEAAARLGPLDGATVPAKPLPSPHVRPISDPSPDPSPQVGAQSAP